MKYIVTGVNECREVAKQMVEMFTPTDRVWMEYKNEDILAYNEYLKTLRIHTIEGSNNYAIGFQFEGEAGWQIAGIVDDKDEWININEFTYNHILTDRNRTRIVIRPIAEEDKGDLGGECYRTSCSNKGANYYNHSTRKHYCKSCAVIINQMNYKDAMQMYGHELCTLVAEEDKPDEKNLHGEIAKGWYDAGKTFEILGDSIEVNGMRWTPVLYDDNEDPDFLKTDAIKLI